MPLFVPLQTMCIHLFMQFMRVQVRSLHPQKCSMCLLAEQGLSFRLIAYRVTVEKMITIKTNTEKERERRNWRMPHEVH